MFSGNWRESNAPQICFDIQDLNITTEGELNVCICLGAIFITCLYAALDIAFGSLYRDEIPLDEVHMCSTIAAASMLQLVSFVLVLVCMCGVKGLGKKRSYRL